MTETQYEYAGFWIRFVASFIDSILMMLLIYPLLTLIYGAGYWTDQSLVSGPLDILLSYILPALAVILFWVYKSATPGKMALRLKIVDAQTGQPASTGKLILRYVGYYVSMIPLFLGFIWAAFDSRKQGWHDKIAGTVVIRITTPPAEFKPGQ